MQMHAVVVERRSVFDNRIQTSTHHVEADSSEAAIKAVSHMFAGRDATLTAGGHHGADSSKTKGVKLG